MTYAEAVKRAETWYEVYNEECDNDPANGEAAYLDADALAVLRRAEPVIAAVEASDLRANGPDAREPGKAWCSSPSLKASAQFAAYEEMRVRLADALKERDALKAEVDAANKECDIKRESLRVAQAEVERLTPEPGNEHEDDEVALFGIETAARHNTANPEILDESFAYVRSRMAVARKAEAELAAARPRLEELERRDKYCWQRTDCVGCPEEVACGKRDDALAYREGKAK